MSVWVKIITGLFFSLLGCDVHRNDPLSVCFIFPFLVFAMLAFAGPVLPYHFLVRAYGWYRLTPPIRPLRHVFLPLSYCLCTPLPPPPPVHEKF